MKTGTVIKIAAVGGVAYYFWPRIESYLGITPAAPAAPAPSTAATVATTTAATATANSAPPLTAAQQAQAAASAATAAYIAATAPPSCPAGFTLDAAGTCTEYTDLALLNGLNTIQWTGVQNIPAEQISRIDPQILAQYVGTQKVNAGSVLAYILGLGDSPVSGQAYTGSDSKTYHGAASGFTLGGVHADKSPSGRRREWR
jgi:hypothetical protein